MTHVYPNETRLFRICLVISIVLWLAVIGGTLGVALLYVAMGALVALFAQSAFISHLRGTGVRVSRQQLPALYEQVLRCCRVLGIAETPEVYVLNANGILNALAARFLRRHYVVLYGDVIDALRERPGALAFYIGHELGHIARGHLVWGPVLWPARLLPILGAAYARAGEYTCDLHGLACCEDPADALHGVAVLAAGGHAASQLDVARYAAQSESSGGFWMSLHELVSDYPWLTKRVQRLQAAAHGDTAELPRRHLLAWFFALFMPHVAGGGAGGSLAAMMVVVAMIGMFAAIAIPNFIKFQLRSKAAEVGAVRRDVQENAERYIRANGKMPPDLASIGLGQPPAGSQVASIEIENGSFKLSLVPALANGLGSSVSLTPYVKDGQLQWNCGPELDASFRKAVCGAGETEAESQASAVVERGRALARTHAQSQRQPQPQAQAEEAPPAAPAPAADSPQRDEPAAASLLGRWRPISDSSGGYREIVFGAAHSVIVTLADGGRALGTFELDGHTVAMEISAPKGPEAARYELTASGDRPLLRPLQGGPFYGKN